MRHLPYVSSAVRSGMVASLLAFGVLLVWLPQQNARAAASLRDITLGVLCSSNLFHSVNPPDLIAAGKVWLTDMGLRRGFRVDLVLEVSGRMEEIRRRAADPKVGVVMLDTTEYLRIASPNLRPVFTLTAGRNRIGQKYQLVVRRDSEWTRVQQLQGKRINIYSRTEGGLGAMWLEVQLDDLHLGRIQTFFGSVTTVVKPSAACLPVFFNKADACVIDDASMQVLEELNPQLASKLQVLEISPVFVEGVIALNGTWPYQNEFVQGLAELDRDPSGKQVLTLFKGDHAEPLTNVDLNSVRELWASYQRLTRKAESK